MMYSMPFAAAKLTYSLYVSKLHPVLSPGTSVILKPFHQSHATLPGLTQEKSVEELGVEEWGSWEWVSWELGVARA